MRFNIFAAIAIFCGLFLTACGGGKPEEQIVGTWKADVDAMAKSIMDDPRMAKVPEEKRKEQLESAKKMFSSMSFEFTKDGKFLTSASMMGKEMKEEGTYKLKNVNGKELTIETVVKGKTKEIKATLDGGQLKMKDKEMELVLKK